MTTSPLHPLQIAAWRRMSPAEKWALAQGAARLVRESVRRRVSWQNPGWDSDAIEREVSRFLACART